MMKFLIAALCLGAAYAECPNGCNQHGKCNLYSACECYRNWMGADCSERVCYFGHAFIDTAQGDLNSDGVVGSSTYQTQFTNVGVQAWELYDLTSHGKGAAAAGSWGQMQGAGTFGTSQPNVDFAPIMSVWKDSSNTAAGTPEYWDEAHFYRECSNKGVCNRQTGQCNCFQGYEGEGCTRTVCPNDCSGHGVCERLKDSNSLYEAWDAYKTQQCVCDAGYMGPDCSLRKCPQGDDPVSRVQVNEVQVFGFSPLGNIAKPNGRIGAGRSHAEDFFGRFALKFTDEFGDSWTTSTLSWPSGPFNVDGLCNGTVLTAGGMSGTKYLTYTDPDRKFSATVGAATMACSVSTTTEIENALKALPNDVIPDVSVSFQFSNAKDSAAATENSGWAYQVTFTDNSGDVNPLEVLYEVTECAGTADCTLALGNARAYSSQGTVEEPTLEGANLLQIDAAGAGHNAVNAYAGGLALRGCTSGATATMIDCPTNDICFAYSTNNIDFQAGEEIEGYSKAVTNGDCGTDIAAVAAPTSITKGVNYFPGWPFATDSSAASAKIQVGASDKLYGGTKGTKENAVCSNRGLCDYTTGLCKCFAGYTKGDCSSQNSLAMN